MTESQTCKVLCVVQEETGETVVEWIDNIDNERRKYVLTEEKKVQICAAVELHNDRITSRQIARELDVSKAFVLAVLKENGYFPYKPKNGQILSADDKQRRMEMSMYLLEQIEESPNMAEKILFSDGCTFKLNRTRNVQQMRTWSRKNPEFLVPTHTQYPVTVNVWCGMLDDKIIGPFFIEGTLTVEKYVALLAEEVGPALVDALDGGDEEIIWQQDRAPAHTAHQVRNLLNEMFDRRWIGKFSPFIEWAPRSPDLTPLDYFFWGHIKSKIYGHVRLVNLEHLKHMIAEIIGDISPEVLRKVSTRTFEKRLRLCVAAEGDLFKYRMR
ncbi:uncharacterized protein LOC117171141 [Belonocnema kinseyi]|uniref:uncharacterized protein LOC117171141 n=1 Tax=Belonocnema kinseyi TaxID=2817044 RepID=UPI00143CE8CB|nr:uncharacterized protein LOC117171141 [Belonocnema kinseyi]